MKEYFASKGWLTKYARAEDSRGMWQKYVDEVELSKVQDPGSMDHGSRTGYENGLSVKQKKALKIIYPKAETELVKKLIPLDKTKLDKANLKKVTDSANGLYDLYGKDVVDNHAKEWAKKSNLEKNRIRPIKIQNLDDMESSNDRANFKRKFREDIAKGYGEFNPDRKSSAAQKRYADHVKRAKTGTFETIVFDAFGRKDLKGTNTPNPSYDLPKLDAIHKNIDEYKVLKKYLETNFGIVTELDHPLDKNTIRTLMNGTPEELTNVNILEQNLNTGFKKQLNNKYFQAVKSGDLNKKRAVEAIANKFNLKIGSVPDGQFFDVSKIDKGVGSFETLNIKDEMLKSLKNASDLDTEWGQYVKDNPGVFKDAGFDLKTLKKPRNVKNITDHMSDIEAKIKELGGKEELKKILTHGGGTTAQKSIIKEITKGTLNFAKGILNPEDLFDLKKQLFSKAALASFPIFDVLDALDDVVRKKISFKEAFANTLTLGTLPQSLGLTKNTDVLNAEKMLKDPNISSAGKEYAQELIDADEYKRLKSTPSASHPKVKEKIKELEEKLTNSKGRGELDYLSALSNTLDKETSGRYVGEAHKIMPGYQVASDGKDVRKVNEYGYATKGASYDAADKTGVPSFSSGQLKKIFGDIEQKEGQLPTTGSKLVPAYVSQNYKTMEPVITPKKAYDDLFIERGLMPQGRELTDKYYQEQFAIPEKWQEEMKQPGMRGASDKFAVGGLAGLMKKYNDKR